MTLAPSIARRSLRKAVAASALLFAAPAIFSQAGFGQTSGAAPVFAWGGCVLPQSVVQVEKHTGIKINLKTDGSNDNLANLRWGQSETLFVSAGQQKDADRLTPRSSSG
ncbi:hypothetical protein LQ948_17600 [Jiella sp. MQZ9-1]|uniref:Uncharacterized protein n=1 Tax=Jiella flava TaxID=2816857 RepID=A0A939G286_9HYPH|nr:hypothetical protein [Jiella flava]MBO0664391.1 hypothetical protein [Jiella flava]MCD2473026.1 hypothetical protein [Jiella flava]